MHEATETDFGSQFVRASADDLWIDSVSQQADSARQIHGRSG